MLKIRLKRIGRKNLPFYRIIVSEKRYDPRGRCLEILGGFNPRDKKKSLILKKERVIHWLNKGADASSTLYNLFITKGLIKGPKRKVVKTHKKEKEKSK
jgi:small subunit ribosomal protein S16